MISKNRKFMVHVLKLKVIKDTRDIILTLGGIQINDQTAKTEGFKQLELYLCFELQEQLNCKR